MPVDFANLVLAPCEDVFGEPVLFDPIASRPGERPYINRGIFTSIAYDVPSLEGVVSDQKTTLGIRLADFVVSPAAKDLVTLRDTVYYVMDIDVDGQGGAELLLRKVT